MSSKRKRYCRSNSDISTMIKDMVETTLKTKILIANSQSADIRLMMTRLKQHRKKGSSYTSYLPDELQNELSKLERWSLKRSRFIGDRENMSDRLWSIFMLVGFNYENNVQIIYPHQSESMYFRMYSHYSIIQVLFSCIYRIPGTSMAKRWLSYMGITEKTNGRHIKSIFTKFDIKGFSNFTELKRKGRKSRMRVEDFFNLMPVNRTNSTIENSDDNSHPSFSYYTMKSFIISGQTIHFLMTAGRGINLLVRMNCTSVDKMFHQMFGVGESVFLSMLSNISHQHVDKGLWGSSKHYPSNPPDRWVQLVKNAWSDQYNRTLPAKNNQAPRWLSLQQSDITALFKSNNQ